MPELEEKVVFISDAKQKRGLEDAVQNFVAVFAAFYFLDYRTEILKRAAVATVAVTAAKMLMD